MQALAEFVVGIVDGVVVVDLERIAPRVVPVKRAIRRVVRAVRRRNFVQGILDLVDKI